MRYFSIPSLLFFLGIVCLGCTAKEPNDDLIFPETILGHWDIEGGGTLFFDETNFSATAGCNTLFGAVEVESDSLIFSLIASTLIACPTAEDQREQELATSLEGATLRYEVAGARARLFNAAGVLVFSLNRPVNANLVNAWELTSIRTANAISSSILDVGTGITFTADGRVNVVTACNEGGGTYTIKENSLSFDALAFTEKGCEQERMTREQEFTQALSQITNFTLLRKTLSLQRGDEVYLSFRLSE
jgi:heat shock protein HslJ